MVHNVLKSLFKMKFIKSVVYKKKKSLKTVLFLFQLSKINKIISIRFFPPIYNEYHYFNF